MMKPRTKKILLLGAGLAGVMIVLNTNKARAGKDTSQPTGLFPHSPFSSYGSGADPSMTYNIPALPPNPFSDVPQDGGSYTLTDTSSGRNIGIFSAMELQTLSSGGSVTKKGSSGRTSTFAVESFGGTDRTNEIVQASQKYGSPEFQKRVEQLSREGALNETKKARTDLVEVRAK